MIYKSLRYILPLLLGAAATARADSFATEGTVNYETAHVSPLALIPNGTKLLAVNTPAGKLMVFDVSTGTPILSRSIPVGLEPVTVRVRSNTEAWVVNQVSDSISIVDLNTGTVTTTLKTSNEPADVVFAGSPQRAFVSCMEPNEVLVFNPEALATVPTRVALQEEEPRSMAVSPDGTKVYVAAYRSGNSTTVLNGRLGPISSGLGLGSENVVSRPEGPYAGRNPAPNRGTTFFPALTATGTAPQSSVIVKRDSLGRWFDDNNGNWSIFVSGSLASLTRRAASWDMPDRDVAVIDAATLQVTYQARLLNVQMAISVKPNSGEVTVVGTDALNQIRFEPNLRGTFLRVNLGRFTTGVANNTVSDLNAHLNYTVSSVAAAQRALSLGDPRGLVWKNDGQTGFVTGMGSNNVVVMGATGNRLGLINVGEGPTGIVLDETNGRGYVLNKFSASVSVLNLNSLTETTQVAYTDPTPAVVKAGRPFLYNTQRTSGLGHVSCASCHIDGKTDHLAWDLGNPAGGAERTGDGFALHPMKGPMLTQTLQDIIRHPSMHWRGDRTGIEAFNPAFSGLMGATGPLTAEEMLSFKNFLSTLHFVPNPFRNQDNTLPTALVLPNGQVANASVGRTSLEASCVACHTGNASRNRVTSAELSQNFVPPAFHAFYERLGYVETQAGTTNNGFGYFHDGADPLFVATRSLDFTAAILTFDGPGFGNSGTRVRQDSHPAVGKQTTAIQANATTEQAAVQTWLNIAAGGQVSVITTVLNAGVRRYFLSTGGNFSSDRATDTRTLAQLISLATAGEPVTFTVVPRVADRRLSVDQNNNGILDGDEAAAPVVTNPGTQNSTRNQSISLQIVATDADSPTLTYSATGLPTGLSIVSTTGRITGTVSQAALASNIVTVSVTDGRFTSSVTFAWNITGGATNLPPVVQNPGNPTSLRGANISFSISASDPENQPLTFSATGLPTGLGINVNSGLISGTVSQSAASSNNVTVIVSDGLLSGSTSFIWNIISPNQAPVVTNPGSRTSTAGTFVSLQIQATDPENNVLSFSASGLPTGLSINSGSGLISGTVALNAAANNSANVFVSDSSLTTSMSFQWNITSTTANGLRGQYFNGRTFNTSVLTRVDPVIDFSWAGSPLNGVDPDNFSVRWAGEILPAFTEDYTFVIQSDNGVKLRVANTELFSVWDPTVGEDSGWHSGTIHLTAGVRSPILIDFYEGWGGASIQLFWFSASQGWGIVPSTSLFPATGTVDTTPPLATLSTTATGAQRLPFPVQILFSEPVLGLTLSDFALSNGTLSNLTGSGTNWSLTVTPGAGAGATLVLPVNSCTDAAGNGNSASNTLNFTYGANRAPTISLPTQTVTRGILTSVQPTANDPDGDALVFSASNLPAGLSISPSTGLISGTVTNTALPTYSSVLTVRDTSNATGSAFVLWTVQNLAANGLRAEYFNGRNFDTPVLTRVDSTIDFDWADGSPAAGVDPDNFTVRWTGSITPAFTEVLNFVVATDNGVRVRVNNQLIIDEFADDVTGWFTGTIALTAGVPANLSVEYKEEWGGAGISMYWFGDQQGWEVLPNARLQPVTALATVGSSNAKLALTQSTAALFAEAKRMEHSLGIAMLNKQLLEIEWELPADRFPGATYDLEVSSDLVHWKLWEGEIYSTVLPGSRDGAVCRRTKLLAAPGSKYFRLRIGLAQ